jgi:hypothetical protein
MLNRIAVEQRRSPTHVLPLRRHWGNDPRIAEMSRTAALLRDRSLRGLGRSQAQVWICIALGMERGVIIKSKARRRRHVT